MTDQNVEKARLISLQELPDIVAEAVKVAQERVGSAAGSGKIIKKWEIYGRILRDLDAGVKFADAATEQVARRGLAVEPAVLKINRDILCGFIERANIPVERQLQR